MKKRPDNHVQALKTFKALAEVFGPLDVDVIALEAQHMAAQGIPQELIPYHQTGFEPGFHGGGAA